MLILRLNPKGEGRNLHFKSNVPSDSGYGGLSTPRGEIRVKSLEKRIRLEIRSREV